MSFIKDENGQGMLEYVLIIALVAVVAVVALFAVNRVLKNKKENVSSQMQNLETDPAYKHQQDNNYITVYVVFYVSIGTKLIQGAGKPAPLFHLKTTPLCLRGESSL